MRTSVPLLLFCIVLAGCDGDPALPGGADSVREPTALPELKLPVRASSGWNATAELGPLVVREGSFEQQVRPLPWSSWWYPRSETTLFKGENGQLSPLEKYDLYVKKTRGTSPGAAAYEESKFDPGVAGWEGHCDAWAAASIVSPEPTRPLEAAGVRFTVADLKALLIKAHERTDGIRYFGARFAGNRGDDYDDVHPDQFHRVLQAEVFTKGRPIVIDVDPGEKVWNSPVVWVESRLSRSPQDASVMQVMTWLAVADPYVRPDYVGTKVKVLLPVLTYDLYGYPRADGSFEVAFGIWTGESQLEHPDFVSVMPANAVHRSTNPAIDSAIVDEILARGRR